MYYYSFTDPRGLHGLHTNKRQTGAT